MAACRLASSSGAPVPVEAGEQAISEIAGKWSGRYYSKATGRRGVITFRMPERADTGFGEVEITFSPALEMARRSSAVDELNRDRDDTLDPDPCTVLTIKMVRIEHDQVRGSMAAYWDPDCNCRTQTVFQGKISGNRIAGTFTSRRESNDRRILMGVWQVDRED
jgi:hypothetical protein